MQHEDSELLPGTGRQVSRPFLGPQCQANAHNGRRDDPQKSVAHEVVSHQNAERDKDDDLRHRRMQA